MSKKSRQEKAEKERAKALGELRDKLAKATALSDVGEKFIALRQVSEELKDTARHFRGYIKRHESNWYGFAGFGAGALASMVAGGALISVNPLFGLLLFPGSIPVGKLGEQLTKSLDKKPTARARAALTEEYKPFLDSLDEMSAKADASAEDILKTRLTELAYSPAATKAIKHMPGLKDAFIATLKKAAETAQKMDGGKPGLTARERFGLGE